MNQRKEVQQDIQYSLTLGLPLLIAAFGIFRWQRRERQRSELRL